MDNFEQKHDVAFFSLCTFTRPYSKSVKWKKFKELYSDKADLIISSSGGIIPLEYENQYPFLTYDTTRLAKYNKLYIQKNYPKMKIFLNKFKYDYIIFNFRPTLRDVYLGRLIKKESENPDNIYIVPSKKVYKLAKKNGFKPSGGYNPDLSYEVLNEINEAFEEIEKKKKGGYL